MMSSLIDATVAPTATEGSMVTGVTEVVELPEEDPPADKAAAAVAVAAAIAL